MSVCACGFKHHDGGTYAPNSDGHFSISSDVSASPPCTRKGTHLSSARVASTTRPSTKPRPTAFAAVFTKPVAVRAA